MSKKLWRYAAWIATMHSNLALGSTNEQCTSVQYKRYVVNTECPLASEAGKRILQRGGNAIDAAIAASLVTGVVNSFSSGIGGGGFMLLRKRTEDGDMFDSFDFREVAPARLTTASFGGDPVKATTGPLAVAVPGEVLGCYEAHKNYGKLPWKELFTDAIRHSKGFKAPNILIQKLQESSEYIMKDPGLREVYTKDGEILKEGDWVVRTSLAATLEEIANDPHSFYRGRLAEKIVRFITARGGVLSLEDLKGYSVKKRTVLEGSFYDFKIYTTNLPTSGLFVIEALKILERINVRDLLRLSSPDKSHYFYHILIEVFKFISLDRGRFGDPDFQAGWEKKVSLIISDIKAAAAFKRFSIDVASDVEGYRTAPFYKEDYGTSHLNVVDEEGTIVSFTTTVNHVFGAKLLDPATGILFNNQIDDFYIPGVDKTHDLQRTQANVLEGGKRPFSSIAPTLLIGGNEIMAIGAAGGARIPASIISTIIYLMAGNTLEKSVEYCRIHNRLFPAVTLIEPTLPDDIVQKLQSMGHKLEVSKMNTTFSSVQAVYMKTSDDGKRVLVAVSDNRKQGRSSGE